MGQTPDSAWISDAIQVQSLVITLWTVYVAIAAAALGFVVSGRRRLRSPATRWCAIVGYVGVAGVNLWAILNVRAQHDLLVQLIRDPALNELKAHMLRPRPAVNIAMHLSLDVGVALMMWFLPPADNRNSEKSLR